ncbi:MDIS1-interacting receptor like kinase 1-like [Phragmites australis]|uniref:MDIS1-interacting receptor like kinase 1-like n=1 Tax=Phragmites australis TaxID=29695 RepID=UPI002D77F07C|nr:MDIS1-interacting receptor like kinase 1-like [Phragmites australis]
MLELSASPFLPAAPVAVELVQPRKLLALQSSGMRLAGGEVSVGLLTSFVLMTLLCGAGVVGICVLGWLLFRRRRGVTALEFSEQDIDNILNNLRDNNVIGSSATGELLYRVTIQDSGGSGRSRTVTVKKLENEIGTVDADLESRCQSEVNKLGVIRHDNIIRLVYYCIRRDSMILLLYEHMENGSLDEWLPHQAPEAGWRRRPPLGWPARRAIAIGVARGLCHLHHGCNMPIVHRSIKPSNILLDGDLKAKIAGFDLAQINPGLNQPLPNSELPAGVLGYTAPEYATMPSEVDEKVDVYSFGVVLLELVTGRLANGPGADGHLATWAQKHHNKLMSGEHVEFRNAVDMDIPDRARHLKQMAAVFKLGVDCTVTDPRERPSMRTVLARLRSSGLLRGLGQCVSVS